MKNIFISILVMISIMGACFFDSPAQALPGWTSGHIRTWITNHAFLAPNFRELCAATTWMIQAHRDLENNEQVVAEYSGPCKIDSQRVKEIYPSNVAFPYVSVMVRNRNEIWENRKNIWTRDSSIARLLLEKNLRN